MLDRNMKSQPPGIDALLQKIEALVDRLTPPAAATPDFEHNLAFRWERTNEVGRLAAVIHPHLYDINELIGIDDIRDEVLRNTSQFVKGFPANNVLLWGERGCGKSSLVKGLLKPFAPFGLRIIELKRWDLMSLPSIMSVVRDLPYRFILFCDDLSFDEGEGDFRALKTLLDGDIEERPANMLIYATSNRRHLVPERMSNNTGDAEIHPEEAVGEKLALSDRFGISIGFYSLDQSKYLDVVREYASSRKLAISDLELCDQALKWAGLTARRSGRSARQFIDNLEGMILLKQSPDDNRTGNQ